MLDKIIKLIDERIVDLKKGIEDLQKKYGSAGSVLNQDIGALDELVNLREELLEWSKEK